MVGYIQQIAQQIEQSASTGKIEQIPNFIGLLPALEEELNRLDPRDFVVGEQYNFVTIRIDVRRYAKELTYDNYADKMNNYNDKYKNQYISAISNMASKVFNVLTQYGGEGSYAKRRSFDFISDIQLKNIIERDYRELTVILFPGGAWKSTVIMAGSILEAILFDVLANNPTRKAKALASSKAPKDKNGNVKPIENENWKLSNLIEVATDIKILPDEREKAIDQALRDYRNFVHPNKEVRSQHQCDEAECLSARGALEGVCNHLEQTL